LNISSFASSEPTFLVIAAGGRGLRMGGGEPKQFRDWGGMPLLEATVRAFMVPEMPALSGIALAVPEERLEQVRAWRFGVPHQTVAGGATRQDSVARALAALPDLPWARVMIHDAVRPFPPAGPVREALAAVSARAAEVWDGAVLGEPSTDTLKRVDPAGRILGTEPREGIFRAQTPQVALLRVWLEAFAWARASGFQGTDDVALLETRGLRVKLIPSPPSNLKLTTPEDWARACPPART
jgi:2-C-methyl-D-erythritol 4-phosphate cytidylyltransferase